MVMQNMSMKPWLAVSGLFVVAACSAAPGNSEYGCPGLPDGVVCQSSRSAYHATNDSDRILSPEAAEAEKRAAGDAGAISPASGVSVVEAQPVVSPDSFNQGAFFMPIRTPAVVMRVWVGPWVTDSGDLMFPGYVMTEIEPRRWEIGHQAPAAYGAEYLQPVDQASGVVSGGESEGRRSRALAAPGAGDAGQTVVRGTDGTVQGRGSASVTGGVSSSGGVPATDAVVGSGGLIGRAPPVRGVSARPSSTYVSPLTGKVRSIEYVYPDDVR